MVGPGRANCSLSLSKVQRFAFVGDQGILTWKCFKSRVQGFLSKHPLKGRTKTWRVVERVKKVKQDVFLRRSNLGIYHQTIWVYIWLEKNND